MPASRLRLLVLVLPGVLAASGCLVVGRADAPPPAPGAAAPAPAVQYALGAVSFQMNEGDPVPSPVDARRIGAALFAAWQRRGYVRTAERVAADQFSADAPFHITLSGSVHADTSVWAQLLNALTLLLVPYPVTNHYDIALSVQPAAGGPACVARAHTADRIWVGLLLVVGLPIAERGADAEMGRLADALYADLVAQGGLGPVPAPQSGGGSPASCGPGR